MSLNSMKNIGEGMPGGTFLGSGHPNRKRYPREEWPIVKSDRAAQKSGDHKTVFYIAQAPVAEDDFSKEPKYQQGSTYRGEWTDNKKDGYGVFEDPKKGTKYEGQWSCDVREGEGIFWEKDVTKAKSKYRKIYSGSWVNGRPEGDGSKFYPNGDSYQGEFAAGVRSGQGEMRYTDGSIYAGQWYSDKRAGHGILTKPNGDIYDGQWVDGKKEGQGCLFYYQKGKVFAGEWADDQPKAGTYSQAQSNPRQAEPMPVTSVLPRAEIDCATEVVQESIDQVQQERHVLRVLKKPLHELLQAYEDPNTIFACLEDAYSLAAQTEQGLVQFTDLLAIYSNLGIYNHPEEIQSLLRHDDNCARNNFSVDFDLYAKVFVLLDMEQDIPEEN